MLHFDELAGTTDAGAAAACVDDCTQNWNPYKENKHTWQVVVVREMPINQPHFLFK